MTDQQKTSAIKRINERMAEIKRTFGENSPEYDRYRQAVDRVAGDYLTKSGNISHGKAALNGLDDTKLGALEQRQTAGKIREDYKRGAEAEDVTEEEYRNMVNNVREKLSGDYYLASDALNYVNFYSKVKGRRPTYQELDDAIQQLENAEKGTREKVRAATIASHFSDSALSVGKGDRIVYGEGVTDSIQ